MSPPSARVDELKKRYEENPRRFFAPLANEYRKAGELDAAIDLCRMHLEEQPGHLSGHIVYGQALFESGRAVDAKATFEAALNLDPENLIALRHLGDIGKADGDAAVATHWYQRVLDADPRNDEVIALIADLQKPRASSSVVVLEELPPPPSPDYSTDTPILEDLSFSEFSAPTPVIPMEAVAAPAPSALPEAPASPPVAPPAVPPRGSIGLMDLDLDLGEAAPPDVDLLGGVPAAPVVAEPAPAATEPEPEFEEGFPLAAEFIMPPVEVFDTSFDVGPPAAEEPTFASAGAAPEFGDSLDVTAAAADIPAAPTPAAPTPAAPTAGDFDMLFGNAPIADVFVGGDTAPAATDDAGFVADAFIGREPVDATLDASTGAGTTPPPFVTETMAELYLQQGFREEALAVYRQLLAQDPTDVGLAERVRHLEHGSRSSMAIDRDSQEIEAAADAEERRQSLELPAVPEPVVEAELAPAPTPPPVPEPEPAFETVPAFMVEAPIAAAPPAPPVPAGPTARDVFARIAQRGVMPGGGSPAIVEPETTPAPVGAVDAGWVPPAELPDASPEQLARGAMDKPRGSIDGLFGAGGVNTDDEGAAVAVASAFDEAAAPEVPAPAVTGQPTYAGTDELSLNSVFHGEPGAAPPAPAVQRQSTRLRFDQFFAGAEESPPASSSSSTVPLPPAPGKSAEDVAQFSDWLKGLKGS